MSVETRKIRVLYVIPTLDVGGAEMDLVHNAPRLDPTRFEVSICCMLHRGPLEERLNIAGNCRIVGPFAAITSRPRSRKARSTWGIGRLMRRIGALIVPRGDGWQRRAAIRIGALIAPIGRGWQRQAATWLSRAATALTEGQRRVIRFAHGLLPAHWIVFYRLARPLVRYVREADIDLVHTILPNAYVVGGIASVMTGRPLVMSRVSLNWYQTEQPVFWFLERRVLHRFVKVAIGNCRDILSQLNQEGIEDRRCQLIYNGIPIPEFEASIGNRAQTRAALGIAPEAFVLCTVANLWRYKGHADLLHALARADLPPGWVALFVGRDIDGYQTALETIVQDLSLGQNVRFLGQRDDVPKLLGATNLYVAASHTEGVPNNILEAMCAGLAVVSTNVGGVPELVVACETGLLVPPHRPDALGEAISRLANDPMLRHDMGCAGRQRIARHFSISRSVETLETIYEGVARRP
jgi:glycosyltransferase involved in cell wall biosynthesis